MGALFEAFRRVGHREVRELTGGVTRWFLHRFQIMATIEGEILDYGENNKVADLDEGRIRRWKGYGFSDAHTDAMNGFSIEGENQTTELMTRHRHSLGSIQSSSGRLLVRPSSPQLPLTITRRMREDAHEGVDITPPKPKEGVKRIVVIGSGPIRIGQGIEFDYGCVHAVGAISGHGARGHHHQQQPGDRLH